MNIMNTPNWIILNFLVIMMFATLVYADDDEDQYPTAEGECCNESIFAFKEDDEVAKNCSEKFAIDWKKGDSTDDIDFESYLCFVDCIFTESKFLVNNTIDLENVKADILTLAENSTELGDIMYESMAECGSLADHMISTLRKNPSATPLFQTKCSPTAKIISDCAAMEYYINCPDKYWKPTAECETRKFYAMEYRFTRL